MTGLKDFIRVTRIDRIFAFAVSKRFGSAFAVFIILYFFLYSFIRTYPYPDFHSIASGTGDDWNTYARYAMNIKQFGILMPLEGRAFYCPGSFLYGYFIAFFIVVFGEKTLPIFAAQHLMLGISVALVYWAFRDKMRGLAGLLFLIAMFVFAFKDVCKNYSPLFLSENLALFTLSIFFYSFVRGFDKGSYPLQLISAMMLGLSVNVRPNIFIFAALLTPVAFAYYIRKGRVGRLAVFVTILVAASSLLMVRNYLVCGKLYFLPEQVSSISFVQLCHPIPSSVDLSGVETGLLHSKLKVSKELAGYIEYAMQEPSAFFGYYLRKAVFCLGYLPALSSAYELRLRWVLMWAGYLAYIIIRLRMRLQLDMWEGALHLFIITFYGSLIISGPVESYGFRMLIPGLNFVLVFSFIALDRFFWRVRQWIVQALHLPAALR